jgi:pyrroloquinoline quinone (PQQ) biosynthesis protein C
MKLVLNQVTADLGRRIEQFPWSNTRAYATWLAQTYYYVAHSTRLLAAAAARMPFNSLGNSLHYRCAAHMAEEKKHELLALHDIKALGESIDDLPEIAATRLLYEPQYAKIAYRDPIALFGYILVLEAMSATHGAAHLSLVTASHGARAASFLKLHSAEDQGHVEKALASLEQLEPDRMRIVEDNIVQTGLAYSLLLDTIANMLLLRSPSLASATSTAGFAS